MSKKRTAVRVIHRLQVLSLFFALGALRCAAQSSADAPASAPPATVQQPSPALPPAGADTKAITPDIAKAPSSATEPIAYDREPLPTDPAAALLLASKANGLGSDELKPWYLKAHYQGYDAKGKPAQAGTIEIFWQDKQHHRVSYASPAFKRDEYHTPDGEFQVGSSDPTPYVEWLVLGEIMHPVRLPHVPTTPKLRDEKVGTISMSCIHLPFERGPEESYCLDHQQPVLRTSQENGYEAIFNKLMVFQHRFVAGDLSLFDEGQKVVTVSVDSVHGLLPADPAAVIPPAGAVRTVGPTIDAWRIDAASFGKDVVRAGQSISKVAPSYPSEAKQRRAQGRVRIWATIGKDGVVHDPLIVRDPDAALSAAALKAVMLWRYAPYLIDGKPVEVFTTINVTFKLGG